MGEKPYTSFAVATDCRYTIPMCGRFIIKLSPDLVT
jgi:hypothetical protein